MRNRNRLADVFSLTSASPAPAPADSSPPATTSTTNHPALSVTPSCSRQVLRERDRLLAARESAASHQVTPSAGAWQRYEPPSPNRRTPDDRPRCSRAYVF